MEVMVAVQSGTLLHALRVQLVLMYEIIKTVVLLLFYLLNPVPPWELIVIIKIGLKTREGILNDLELKLKPSLPWPLGHVRLISFLVSVCAALLFFSAC